MERNVSAMVIGAIFVGLGLIRGREYDSPEGHQGESRLWRWMAFRYDAVLMISLGGLGVVCGVFGLIAALT